MCSTPNRLREFRRRRLVSVPGTRLKRPNSLFKQQILNFSTLPVMAAARGVFKRTRIKFASCFINFLRGIFMAIA
jgi:hypothetical protein